MRPGEVLGLRGCDFGRNLQGVDVHAAGSTKPSILAISGSRLYLGPKAAA